MIDDTPVELGSGPGQSPNPFFSSSANPFDANLPLNLGPSLEGRHICARIEVNDGAVDEDGEPGNLIPRIYGSYLRAAELAGSH